MTTNNGTCSRSRRGLCDYRLAQDITGPLHLGIDSHALSAPAAVSALEVFAANGVDVMLAADDDYTPTPAVSHAILTYNRGRDLSTGAGLADGVVITPSHNPPRDGGYKYNPPHGGPADQGVTGWIEAAANRYLEARMQGVKHILHRQALEAATTHRHDFRSAYVADLDAVIDLAAIRVDPSSVYAMQRMIALKDQYQIAFSCDTDHDRHGTVTATAGLMPPNNYLSVAIDYLFRHRPRGNRKAAVGKTVVSTQLIEQVAAGLGRNLLEVPVGFKWFSAGLLDGSLGFGGEESVGASFLRRDGTVWITDKDGIIADLLAAEITARTGHDPGAQYATLTQKVGSPVSRLPRRRRRSGNSPDWRPTRSRRANSRARRSSRSAPPRRAKAPASAASRSSRRTAGLPPGHPAPKRSTRSTPRASRPRPSAAPAAGSAARGRRGIGGSGRLAVSAQPPAANPCR